MLSGHAFDIMKSFPIEVSMLLAAKIGNLENKGWFYFTKMIDGGSSILLLPPEEDKGDENLIKGELCPNRIYRLR